MLRASVAAGWGNAMRYMLTGDHWSAQEAYRVGTIQEIAATPKAALDRAFEIANKVAACGPLGIKSTLASAHLAVDPAADDSLSKLDAQFGVLFHTQAFLEGGESTSRRSATRLSRELGDHRKRWVAEANNSERRGDVSMPFVELFTREELSNAVRAELAETLLVTMMNIEIGHPTDHAREIGWVWFHTLPGTSWAVGGRFDDTYIKGRKMGLARIIAPRAS